jgi:dihydropteroate synthase
MARMTEGVDWRCGAHVVRCGERTLVMGIVNVTPDSFSDGGMFDDAAAAVAHASELADQGADILDIGGESTRPGSDAVSAADEIARVVPVIEGLVAALPSTPISVDTRKGEVAAAALAAGAAIVNDVSAGADPAMFPSVAATGAGMILMHMRGEPKTMQVDPTYDDVVGEVHGFLRERMEAAVFAGIAAERLALDPGIGFGKNLDHNLALLRALDRQRDLGAPLVVGVSRKRFLGTLTGTHDPADRLEATAAAVAWCAAQGVDVVRVHDVVEMVRVVAVVDAIARGVR